MNINKELLDKLAQEAGKEIKEGDVVTKEGAELEDFVNESIENIHEAPSLAYGDSAGPIPGENITDMFEQLRDVNGEESAERLIQQNALNKAKLEGVQMTPEEKKMLRQQTIDQLMYQAEEAYFIEHRYIMDGRTKRRTRALIERNYDKGRYNNRKPKSKLNG